MLQVQLTNVQASSSASICSYPVSNPLRSLLRRRRCSCRKVGFLCLLTEGLGRRCKRQCWFLSCHWLHGFSRSRFADHGVGTRCRILVVWIICVLCFGKIDNLSRMLIGMNMIIQCRQSRWYRSGQERESPREGWCKRPSTKNGASVTYSSVGSSHVGSHYSRLCANRSSISSTSFKASNWRTWLTSPQGSAAGSL